GGITIFHHKDYNCWQSGTFHFYQIGDKLTFEFHGIETRKAFKLVQPYHFQTKEIKDSYNSSVRLEFQFSSRSGVNERLLFEFGTLEESAEFQQKIEKGM
ncbi:UNVERIFIED_CONTAM: hypothetical protein HDU68_006731, partial [Siphonaria sp. JEL0065]